MSKVLCYGVVGVDVLLQIGEYPEANGHARVKREAVLVGGEAANTAVRLSQLGVDAILMGNAVGQDANGDLIRAKMAASRVDCRVETHHRPTGHAFVVSDEAGNRTMFGAFGDLVGPAVPDSVLKRVDLVTVDPFVEGAVEVAGRARALGITVLAIEVAPDHALAAVADVVINSAGRVRRHALGDPADLARELLLKTPEVVIVTHGGAGADVYTSETAYREPVHPVEVIDTTGAGDAFRAGYILGVLSGHTLRGSVRIASVAGAISCCYFGGCEGSLARGQVLAEARPA